MNIARYKAERKRVQLEYIDRLPIFPDVYTDTQTQDMREHISGLSEEEKFTFLLMLMSSEIGRFIYKHNAHYVAVMSELPSRDYQLQNIIDIADEQLNKVVSYYVSVKSGNVSYSESTFNQIIQSAENAIPAWD